MSTIARPGYREVGVVPVFPGEFGEGQTLEVFFDGACPLCSREVKHYQRKDFAQRVKWVDIAGSGFEAERYGLNLQRLNAVMHAKDPTGRVFTEVGAFLKIWEAVPTFATTVMGWAVGLPGVKSVASVAYRIFARNRYSLTGRCTPESCAINAKR